MGSRHKLSEDGMEPLPGLGPVSSVESGIIPGRI